MAIGQRQGDEEKRSAHDILRRKVRPPKVRRRLAKPIFFVCSAAVAAGVFFAFFRPMQLHNPVFTGRLFFRLLLLAAAQYWLVWRAFLE